MRSGTTRLEFSGFSALVQDALMLDHTPTSEERFDADLALDSLGWHELAALLENLGAEFPEEQLSERCETVGDGYALYLAGASAAWPPLR